MYLFKSFAFVICLSCLIILFLPAQVFAHGGEKHGKKAETRKKPLVAKADSATVKEGTAQDTITFSTTTPEAHAGHVADKSTVHASLSDFPDIHPLLVHFPIMLLLLAAVIQVVNILFLKKELNWTVTLMVLAGFITAYAATTWAHPHTTGLSAHAQLVLEQHDLYALYTIYLAGLGLVAQLLSLFAFKGKRWSIAVAAIVLVGAGYTVSMAGHYGAQLVHIEGVGPEGKFLEQHHSQ
jgi:uncharacterized membrane protein